MPMGPISASLRVPSVGANPTGKPDRSTCPARKLRDASITGKLTGMDAEPNPVQLIDGNA
jgi:hypothetical protein